MRLLFALPGDNQVGLTDRQMLLSLQYQIVVDDQKLDGVVAAANFAAGFVAVAVVVAVAADVAFGEYLVLMEV